MDKRKKKYREDEIMLQADGAGRVIEVGPEQSALAAQNAIAATIEISDDDYRTLHLPCDDLEEGEDGKPGH